VSTTHAPFPTEVEFKMPSITHLRISSRMTLPDPTRCPGCCPPFALKNRLLQPWSELQIRFMQLEREGSPTPGLRLPQAKLSRNSNQVARGRIRQFESDMPSQAVRLSTLLRALDRAAFLGARDRETIRAGDMPSPT
jgi:hypothetical protein